MPQLNSKDIQILSNARRRKFKYAFIDDYHGEEMLLRYGDARIDEFEHTVRYIVLDPENADEYFDEDDWECTYSGDRDSPPEYDLRDDAEACPVIQVLRNTTECMLLDFSDYSLYLFNTPSMFQRIFKEYGLPTEDILRRDKRGVYDIYPDSLKIELVFSADCTVIANELEDLFN